MRFDPAWREHLTLRNGTPVVLRQLRPEDRDLLADGFAHLSPQARYQRFHGVKDALSPADLRYLTELDGKHHFALGATTADGKHGLGVARFVELEPGIAEPAVTVADECQGQGLGRLLLQRLIEAAQERGVHAFRFEVLADNQPMIKLLHELAPGAVAVRDGCEVTLEMPLARHTTGLFALLELAARGLLVVLQERWAKADSAHDHPKP